MQCGTHMPEGACGGFPGFRREWITGTIERMLVRVQFGLLCREGQARKKKNQKRGKPELNGSLGW
jgi:hypothetical protein